ncbi:ABC transporter permease [Paenibacillus methanolicus]|uniref:Putative aldouronate transport system permease protein n=1 Tax=Paenibacillus methanolicus TaxID=582686 RepID=A0A5S5CGT1_9BACL|nr:ABC transporter permease subunit [Paenibacillus methanolicus]TYP78986.1 putative aldouronate transport system permease protein [Paenibacillus methanolicus]
MKSSIIKRFKRDRIYLLLLVPLLLYYALFRYAPMFGIAVSFLDYNLFKGFWASDWVGLKHYNMFINNPDAWNIIRNTLVLGGLKLLFLYPAPIILAILFHEMRWKKYRRFVQTVSYMPFFLSSVVVSSILIMLLSPSTGWINQLIVSLGFEPIYFLQQSEWFRPIYIGSDIWQHVGFGTIIYLAALSSIDPQLYEAAKIDGAGRWKQTLHVTLPGIVPAMVIVFILQIGGILELSFDKAFLLGNTATLETSDIISTYVYRIGILGGSFSYAAAIDLSMAVISFLFIYSANKVSRRVGETSLW